jgi:ribonuclease HII
MTEALRRAANRALCELAAQGFEPDRIVLDGKHDYLAQPRVVRTIVKADQTGVVGCRGIGRCQGHA